MARSGRPMMPVDENTAAHKVLTLLMGVNATAIELYAACGCREDSVTTFRARVLASLRKRELVETGPQGTLRITYRGLLAIGATTPPPVSLADMARSAPPNGPEPQIERWMLTTSPGRARSMTEADKLPPPMRRDGQEHLQHPSRRGNRLYYRDGRVTDMAGNPIEVSA